VLALCFDACHDWLLRGSTTASAPPFHVDDAVEV
jgi:hypothetical protein